LYQYDTDPPGIVYYNCDDGYFLDANYSTTQLVQCTQHGWNSTNLEDCYMSKCLNQQVKNIGLDEYLIEMVCL